MVDKWYHELPNKFNDIKCHEKIVMPYHFHCIIENTGVVPAVGTNLCVRPSPPLNDPFPLDEHALNDHKLLNEHNPLDKHAKPGEHKPLGEYAPLRECTEGEHIGSPYGRSYNGLKP